MKRWLVIVTVILTFALAACGNAGSDKEKDNKEELTVGATNVPHAEILEKAKPLLKEQGIDLKIKTFQDYSLPNRVLADGEIDANFFQHIPFFESEVKEKGYDLVNAGGIHIEPIGVYSKKYKSLEDLPEGAQILMSSSIPDHGRISAMLEEKGLIKLKENVDKVNATIDDIAENPKKLEFNYEFDAAYLPQVFENNEGDAVLINSNYALDVGLNPSKDAIALEDKESPYVNIIAVRKEDENNEKIKALVDVLHSKEMQDFILDEWKGSVVPVADK